MKCAICNSEFTPKNRRQVTCERKECKAALKARAQQRWADKQPPEVLARRSHENCDAKQARKMAAEWQERRAAILSKRDPLTKRYS